MTRMSKKGERRGKSPRKHKAPSTKTGPKKDNLPMGFKAHKNAVEGDLGKTIFVPKIK